jgi:signal transduction histidine kinase
MNRLFRSLQAKYMLIILMALFLIQATYLFIAIFVFTIGQNLRESRAPEGTPDPQVIEKRWHAEAGSLAHVSAETVAEHFARWKTLYPAASMFWVDEHGALAAQLDVKAPLPSEWTASFTAKFIKERYGGDPFTVIAFVGPEGTKGFIVFEIPRTAFDPPLVQVNKHYGSILIFGMVVVVCLFILVSYLFFRGIRKRLLHVQEAMAIKDTDGLPVPIRVKKQDEIGQLERTFNEMVAQLKESKRREREEEQLRRELIANLSHDLRTPLTKIRAQTYSIGKEALSPEGRQAMESLEASVEYIDRLMENLMAYSLLMASKLHYEPQQIDVVRYVREHLASWYPVFEKEGFVIDIDIRPLENNRWTVDPGWLGRVLDNLLQNVLRHAKEGKYLAVGTESTDRYDAIVISDRGRGMNRTSGKSGAGIGLSIVDRMVRGMKLDWEMESGEGGTTVRIKKPKKNEIPKF